MEPQHEIGSILHFHEVQEAQKHWGRFFVLGLLMSLLGCWAIGAAITTTLLSIVTLGLVFIAAGIIQVVHGLWAHQWKGVLYSLFIGVLYGVIGVLCVVSPAVTAITLTLLIGTAYLVAGLFRITASLMLRCVHWGWLLFNGLVTLVLGLIIVAQWPISGLWVIGLFVGIDILAAGLSLVLLSLSARRYGM